MPFRLSLLLTLLFAVYFSSAIPSAYAKREPVPRHKYDTALRFGTFIGFGSGHAIHGDYLQRRAWLFTLADSYSLAAAGVGIAGANTELLQRDIADIFIVSGIITFLVSKSWQIFDLAYSYKPQESASLSEKAGLPSSSISVGLISEERGGFGLLVHGRF